MKKKYWTIVGSRNTPEHVLELMIRMGRTLTDNGISVSSGDAYDSDRAGWYGARQSKRYAEVGARVYLANGTGRNFYRLRDNRFFYDASGFTDTWNTAMQMAMQARGSFGGLNEWGKALHTRNVYQIHGEDLKSLSDAIIYYAEPIGKRENEKVSGGTNTALRLAVMADIPIRKNLYFQDDYEWCGKWLEEHELKYPYIDINWQDIHRPDDPRLLREPEW